MMKIENESTTFQLQARTDLATNGNGTSINATIFSAFAMQDHTGAIVQVEMSRKKNSKLMPYCIQAIFCKEGPEICTVCGIEIVQ
jgi:hypothetical protein